MEILLTVLIWLWQIGWTALLSGLVCAALVQCIKPLRRHKVLSFTLCAAAVCLLLAALCVEPIVLGAGAEEKEQVQQLAAGLYSEWIPVTPVCAVVEKDTVQVWYAFVGCQTYIIDSDGLPSIIDRLGPWE